LWHRLTLIWISYAVFASALNGYVTCTPFTTEQWVNFKILGLCIPTVSALLAQGLYIRQAHGIV
jgi:intracellular septation protein A